MSSRHDGLFQKSTNRRRSGLFLLLFVLLQNRLNLLLSLILLFDDNS